MKKECCGCGLNLDPGEFNFKNRVTGQRQPQCRTCTRQQLRDHYLRNTAYFRTKARTAVRSLRAIDQIGECRDALQPQGGLG